MIRIYDDTGSGDNFNVSTILFEDNEILVGEATNERCAETIKVMISKKTREVFGVNLIFYEVIGTL